MTTASSQLASIPVVPRFAVVGLTLGLVVGGLVGLILGLHAHPATAWFAVFELGVPAGMCGALLGALVGLVAAATHRFSHH